jgi:hypothetical protein
MKPIRTAWPIPTLPVRVFETRCKGTGLTVVAGLTNTPVSELPAQL